MHLAVTAVGVGTLLAYLALERLVVRRIARSIPVRIAVAGTRGKSSVVRLIAAGLSAGGWRVIAKTTGSRAAVIIPSGEELLVSRRGTPTILEQKRVLCVARRERARALVVEVMSIKPENYAVELEHLIRPQVLAVVGNARKVSQGNGRFWSHPSQRSVPPGTPPCPLTESLDSEH